MSWGFFENSNYDSVGLGYCLGFCIPYKSPGNDDTTGRRTILCEFQGLVPPPWNAINFKCEPM